MWEHHSLPFQTAWLVGKRRWGQERDVKRGEERRRKRYDWRDKHSVLPFLIVVQSYSLWSHGLLRTRPPCPSLSPRVYSNSCPLSPCCHPTISSSIHHSLPLLPSIFPSIRVIPNELAFCIRCLKYWSFSFSISPSNEYSGLVSFRIDWFVLLAVHGTLKTLLQHYDSKDLIFWRSAFFMVQLSHPYMTNGKTIVLTIQTLVSNVMSLLFNTIIAFLLFSFAPLVSPPQFGKTTWLYLGKQGAYRTQTQHWASVLTY